MHKAILKKLRRRKPNQLEFHELVLGVQQRFSKSLDISRFGKLDPAAIREELRLEVGKACDAFCTQADTTVCSQQREEIIDRVLDDAFGLGPLEGVLRDDSVLGVKIEGLKDVELDDGDEWQPSGIEFRDEDHYCEIMERIRLSGLFRIAEINVVDPDRNADEQHTSVIVIRRIASLVVSSKTPTAHEHPEPTNHATDSEPSPESISLKVVGFDDEFEESEYNSSD